MDAMEAWRRGLIMAEDPPVTAKVQRSAEVDIHGHPTKSVAYSHVFGIEGTIQ